jgi:hypothetical protein
MDETIAIRFPSLVIPLKIVCCAASLAATHLLRSLRLPNVRRKRHQKKPTPQRYPLQIPEIKSIELQRDQQRTIGVAAYKVWRYCSDCNLALSGSAIHMLKPLGKPEGSPKGLGRRVSAISSKWIPSPTSITGCFRHVPEKLPARISMASFLRNL